MGQRMRSSWETVSQRVHCLHKSTNQKCKNWNWRKYPENPRLSHSQNSYSPVTRPPTTNATNNVYGKLHRPWSLQSGDWLPVLQEVVCFDLSPRGFVHNGYFKVVEVMNLQQEEPVSTCIVNQLSRVRVLLPPSSWYYFLLSNSMLTNGSNWKKQV